MLVELTDYNNLGTWVELQKEMLKLSSHGTGVAAVGAGHGIPWQRPDVVIEAVRSLCTREAQGQLMQHRD